MGKRPANDEMVQGFIDGHDLSAPEPSNNRSNSYRHGFMCGRIDKGKIASPGYEELCRMADEAMKADEPNESKPTTEELDVAQFGRVLHRRPQGGSS